jgi:hypothetical protein
MKIVIAGGSGHIGAALIRHLREEHELVVLTRSSNPMLPVRAVCWDAKTLGPWAAEIDGAEVIINLAGRSVDCRYTAKNRQLMLDSWLDSTRVIGAAIAAAKRPPALWLQSSTATYYAHRLDRPNDEFEGRLGDEIHDRPARWNFSTQIARRWEETLFAAATPPTTRKIALRSAMTMTPDAGSIFHVLATLARRGLGGTCGNGLQWVS